MAEQTPQPQRQKKRNLPGLARKLSRLPSEKKKAAIETSASLAAVSLKVSKEFVEAVPKASKLLSAEDLRAWGELGRKIAMADADLASEFFRNGIADLRRFPPKARSMVFTLSSRQLILSNSIAIDTFNTLPALAESLDDDLLTEIVTLAAEIAGRSARHSADFLDKTPAVANVLAQFGKDQRRVASAAIELARDFATRTGGMTADLWAALPNNLKMLNADDAIHLLSRSRRILEFGGSVTLHFVSSGSIVLEKLQPVFESWFETVLVFASHGNAVLISLLRAAPTFFSRMATIKNINEAEKISLRVFELVREIAETDSESGLAAFISSAKALEKVSLAQFEEWVETGLRSKEGASAKARRSFFALETRSSNELLQDAQEGLALENIQNILRIYVEGLTGKEIEIAPISAMPQESRIGDGKTIYLPAKIKEFDDDEIDFRLFKVLAAHGAGQIEFGTFETGSKELKAAYVEMMTRYEASAEQLDAFSLAGYIEEVQKGERALTEEEFRKEFEKKRKRVPKNVGYRDVMRVFPEPGLARKIFGTMENARIDFRLRNKYKGLIKDINLMEEFLRGRRPYIFDLPMHQVPFELLFQITMCGGATEDAKHFYGQVVTEIETAIESFLRSGKNYLPTVADSIMAAGRVYNLFQNISPEQQNEEATHSEEKAELATEDAEGEAVTESQIKREERKKETQDVRDLFSAWNAEEEETDSRSFHSAEQWAFNDMPEQALEPGDEAFSYDEWDRELADFRTGWCRVIEKSVRKGDRNFVELARSRYRGVISSIRHQFQLMKPENLTKINRELDGEDFDLSAVIDYVIDRRADGQQSERLYTKRLRRERDVAVSLLLDQSSSTARTITRNPLQPYTNPGRRIIEIEKEGLVLMSEALEAVGDVYSINGFTSEGRRNVKFYVVKDFDEKYSDEIERKIGGITFQNNTRLGAAIRHAAAKLLKQESRTKLMIILTDGRPYDHDYGDAKYAKDDVREALTEARINGITPFCITIDKDSEQELRDLYGEVGYTIIDDVLSLPEKLPNIYRRLTT
ncbi:MAG: nitric oxide reductase activation protein NorD [Pyrinomonadaceae bacterium]